MKKIIALFLILAVSAASLSGCKGGETTEAPTSASETTKAPDESGTPAPSTTAADETTAPAPAFEADYSKYLDDYGYIEGVKASDLIPEIDYSKIEVKASDIRDDANHAVETVIANLTGQFVEKITNRAVKDGDTLNIGYVGKMDGVPFEGGTTDSTDVTIGVTQYIDGFLPQLIGHKPGETFDIDVTFPNPYQPNPAYSGKPAVFTITIHYISESPEFNDDFVKAHWDAVKEFPDAEEGMSAEELRRLFFEYYYDYYINTEVYSAVSELEIEAEVPETAKLYVENADNCTYYEQYGMTFTDLLRQYYGYTDEQIGEVFTEEARRELIFQAYYEKAGWKVEESEYHEATGQEDNAESIEKLGKGYIARYVMLERALDELKEKVTIVND
ncbi:MAG: FKBP-type peptidyl-prolyl cis-trans isomerase [Lachnospiraceae bacterium]|nr:FKBP-type peptidyl-prolyl cis-trans isomerase [Lachnospiraceae bacterium]